MRLYDLVLQTADKASLHIECVNAQSDCQALLLAEKEVAAVAKQGWAHARLYDADGVLLWANDLASEDMIADAGEYPLSEL